MATSGLLQAHAGISKHSANFSDRDTVTLSPIVSVTVGDPITRPETHKLHRGLLCLESELFSACLQGRFEQASSLEVNLPDVDPGLFCEFAKWLYTDDIAPFPKGMKDELIADLMVDLYVLDERLLLGWFEETSY